MTRFVKILDLARIQRTWERRQVWRTEGRRQVVGCSGCRNCLLAFSLHDSIRFGSAVGLGLSTLLCEVRVVHVLHAKACMSSLWFLSVIPFSLSCGFVMIYVGPAFWNKLCTGFHSCYAWLKVFADALKQVSLLLPSLLNAQLWHSAVINKKKSADRHSRRSMPLRWNCHSNPYRRTICTRSSHDCDPRNPLKEHEHNVGRYHPKKIMRGISFCPLAQALVTPLQSAKPVEDSAVVHETPRGLILGSKIAMAKRRIAAATWQIK